METLVHNSECNKYRNSELGYITLGTLGLAMNNKPAL